MSMSIKKSRLFKLLAVAALVVVMAIGTALPSFASSEDKKLYFQTTGNAYEVCIPTAQKKEDSSSVYCWIQTSSEGTVKSAKVNVRGGENALSSTNWPVCNSSMNNGRVIYVGTSYFIYNNVYEAGFKYVTLSFTSSKASIFRGVWSPDSVYQSGVAQI